jgi:hypothetical protein
MRRIRARRSAPDRSALPSTPRTRPGPRRAPGLGSGIEGLGSSQNGGHPIRLICSDPTGIETDRFPVARPFVHLGGKSIRILMRQADDIGPWITDCKVTRPFLHVARKLRFHAPTKDCECVCFAPHHRDFISELAPQMPGGPGKLTAIVGAGLPHRRVTLDVARVASSVQGLEFFAGPSEPPIFGGACPFPAMLVAGLVVEPVLVHISAHLIQNLCGMLQVACSIKAIPAEPDRVSRCCRPLRWRPRPSVARPGRHHAFEW